MLSHRRLRNKARGPSLVGEGRAICGRIFLSDSHFYRRNPEHLGGKSQNCLAPGWGARNLLRMVKQAMIFATVLSVALVLGILGYSAYQQRQQFARVKSEFSGL